MDIEGFRTMFHIPEDKMDEAILSLTQKQFVNNQRGNKYNDKLDFYCYVGTKIFVIFLGKFIANIFHNDMNLINTYLNSSKSFFQEKFFNIYGLKNFILLPDNVELNQRIVCTMTNQFIGFLYLSISYENLRQIVFDIFSKDELKIDDYLSLVNILSNSGKNIYTELEQSGQDHNKVFVYEMNLNEKKIKAQGTSKKLAQNECARLYCEQYLSKQQIIELLSSRRKYGYRKKYVSKKDESILIKNIARNIGISERDLQKSITHISFSHIYDEENNSIIKMIGAFIKSLFLLLYIKEIMSLPSSCNLLRVVGFIDSLDVLSEKVVKFYGVDEIIRSINVPENGMPELYRSIETSLIYMGFCEKNTFDSSAFFDTIKNIYKDYLDTIDYRYIEPSSALQELFPRLSDQLYYQDDNTIDNKVTCKMEIQINNRKLVFSGIDIQKKNARHLAIEKFLHFFHDTFIPFFHGESMNDCQVNMVEILSDFIVQDQMSMKFLLKEYNLFFCNDLVMTDNINDLYMLILNLQKMFQVIQTKFEDHITQKILGIIFETLDKKIFYYKNEDILAVVLVRDIWEESLSVRIYSLENRLRNIKEKNEKLLQKYIQKNPNFIGNLKNPSLNIQFEAISIEPGTLGFFSKIDEQIMDVIYDDPKYTKYIQRSNDLLNDALLLKVKNNLKQFISNNSCEFLFLDDNISFEIYLKAIFELYDIKKFYIATGFVYASGLRLLETEISNLLKNNHDLRIIIGSLQTYFTNGPISGIDRNTARKINELIELGAKVKTYPDRFYHGKLYFFETETVGISIMGSSNMSRTAFHNNRELDCMFVYRDKEQNPLKLWFQRFWDESQNIDFLDEERFGDMIQTDNENNLKTITVEAVKKRAEDITDDILRSRLLLWLKYAPSNIYENIDVAGNDYIAIEYQKEKMLVLESFIMGNAYFVFYRIDIKQLITLIENKTKTEIFQLSNMEKKGYHIRKMLSLELNIKSYFIGGMHCTNKN